MAPDQALERRVLAGTGQQHELGIFVWREGRHGRVGEPGSARIFAYPARVCEGKDGGRG
jgi:hypothetical protein